MIVVKQYKPVCNTNQKQNEGQPLYSIFFYLTWLKTMNKSMRKQLIATILPAVGRHIMLPNEKLWTESRLTTLLVLCVCSSFVMWDNSLAIFGMKKRRKDSSPTVNVYSNNWQVFESFAGNNLWVWVWVWVKPSCFNLPNELECKSVAWKSESVCKSMEGTTPRDSSWVYRLESDMSVYCPV